MPGVPSHPLGKHCSVPNSQLTNHVVLAKGKDPHVTSGISISQPELITSFVQVAQLAECNRDPAWGSDPSATCMQPWSGGGRKGWCILPHEGAAATGMWAHQRPRSSPTPSLSWSLHKWWWISYLKATDLWKCCLVTVAGSRKVWKVQLGVLA